MIAELTGASGGVIVWGLICATIFSLSFLVFAFDVCEKRDKRLRQRNEQRHKQKMQQMKYTEDAVAAADAERGR